MLSDKEEQESQALIPLVQDTVLFNGHPLVVVRLPDGQPGVVLRWICENLHISPAAQVERIKRTEVIADDLATCAFRPTAGHKSCPLSSCTRPHTGSQPSTLAGWKKMIRGG